MIEEVAETDEDDLDDHELVEDGKSPTLAADGGVIPEQPQTPIEESEDNTLRYHIGYEEDGEEEDEFEDFTETKNRRTF